MKLIEHSIRIASVFYSKVLFSSLIYLFIIYSFFGKIINIHPSLLPAFPGLNAQKKAIKYGVKFSGCTVHFVDVGVDSGPIILQTAVPVYDNDCEESLSKRILKQEHYLYPKAIAMIIENKFKLDGRTVIFNKT